ncbi:ROK family protein [Paenibacillus sp. NPDC056579]|uniref:ROK family protein n=1 Tax=Paenibacillus sp. NPDC056579 TaxID=3345871 RepID=UPI0036917484
MIAQQRIPYDASSEYAVGVDVGGTKINVGLIREAGEVVLSRSLETCAGTADTASRIMEAVDALLGDAAGRIPALRLRGIGVGTAGQVDWSEGSIRFASDLIPGYAGTPLKRLLQQRYGLPACVDNDVNVLALTEKKLGSGRGVKHLLCLTLGTGVGGAVMIDGRIVHGAWGGAGEIGHMSVDLRGERCVCGSVGCLEQYASGTGIARRMQERLARLGSDGGERVGSREVLARWRAGEPEASAVMADAFAALGSAIASLVHIFNPEVIVIGGGVAEAGAPLFERIREEAGQRAMASLFAGVRIEPAYQGNWNGMIGAALQMWEYEEIAGPESFADTGSAEREGLEP